MATVQHWGSFVANVLRDLFSRAETLYVTGALVAVVALLITLRLILRWLAGPPAETAPQRRTRNSRIIFISPETQATRLAEAFNQALAAEEADGSVLGIEPGADAAAPGDSPREREVETALSPASRLPPPAEPAPPPPSQIAAALAPTDSSISDSPLPSVSHSPQTTESSEDTNDSSTATRGLQHSEFLDRLREAMQALGEDAAAIVQRLVRLAGEALGADFAMFCSRKGDLIYVRAEWRMPDGYPLADRAEGHVATAMLSRTTPEPVVLRNLSDDPSLRADLLVSEHGTRTAVGCPVRTAGGTAGALCVFFQSDVEPALSSMQRLSLLAAAIATQEEREHDQEQSRRLNAKLKAFASVARQVSQLVDADSLVSTLIRQVQEVTGSYNVNLFLQRGDELVLAAAQGGFEDGRPPATLRVPSERCAAGRAAQTHQPILISDTSADPACELLAGLPDTCSELAVPIISGENLLGVLDIQSKHPGAFEQSDIEPLCLLADQFAVALVNAQLFEQTRQRARELESLAQVSSALRHAASRAEMAPIILTELQRLFSLEAAAFIARSSSDDLVIEHARGDWADLTGNAVAGDLILWKQAFQAHHPILTDPSRRLPRLTGVEAFDRYQSLACIPLVAQRGEVGVLLLARRTAFTDTDRSLMQAIADMAANALARATLFEQTERRLGQVQALHTIDLAINASLDLRVTLHVLIEQAVEQLGADAATILLVNPHCGRLECAGARGFRVRHPERFSLALGESLAGRAALEKRPVSVPDLSQAPSEAARAAFTPEGFVSYHAAPLVAKGKVQGVLEVFHRRPHRGDDEWMQMLSALAAQAAIAVDNATLFEDLQAANTELMQAYDATIEGWSRALELRDRETEGHTLRVTEMTIRLAREFNVPEKELVHIRRAALLHDIGKMGVPDSILLKPGKLTDEEMEIMRRHTVYAYELLRPIRFLRPALEIPWCHHEKWDGSGYPRGLKGEEIPLAARLFAIIDVWDALRYDRPYRKAWPEPKVLEYIQSQSGTHFEPAVVETFLKMRAAVLDSAAKTGMLGNVPDASVAQW